MKIKTQLIASVVFIIILSISATTFVMVNDARNLLFNEIDEKGKLVINYLSGVMPDPIIKRDEVTLISYIKKAADTPGILYILAADDNGRVLASSNSRDIGKKISGISPRLLKKEGIITLNYAGKEREVINFNKEIILKMEGESVPIGGISAGFKKSYVDNKLTGIYVKSGVIAAGVIIISVLFVLGIASRITKPLNKLIEGTEIIASGNMKHKIRVNVKNEFQALANSFNAMTDKINDYYDGILNAFTMALDQKDKYSPGHGRRVANLAMELAGKLNLSPAQIENIRIASILKDIGNIGISGNVFSKKETLSPDDLIKIQEHPEISARIIKSIPPLQDVVPIVLQHHERHDGLGYPKGLKGDEIVTEAKILSIVDAYDAMITKREHREAFSPEEALYEIRQNKGKQFDPDITEAFVEFINKKGGK